MRERASIYQLAAASIAGYRVGVERRRLTPSEVWTYCEPFAGTDIAMRFDSACRRGRAHAAKLQQQALDLVASE